MSKIRTLAIEAVSVALVASLAGCGTPPPNKGTVVDRHRGFVLVGKVLVPRYTLTVDPGAIKFSVRGSVWKACEIGAEWSYDANTDKGGCSR